MTLKKQGKHKELSEALPSLMMHNDAGCCRHPVVPCTVLTFMDL